jgi:7,8-dihydroneopterin aldolase/epimerase/oxygenase
MKIGIKDVQFFAFHGYYEEERKFGNNFVLNMEVTVADDSFIFEDLNSTINYADLFLICKIQMDKTKLLIESVATSILSEVKLKWPHILAAKIRIDKLGPQLGGVLSSSFVELELLH